MNLVSAHYVYREKVFWGTIINTWSQIITRNLKIVADIKKLWSSILNYLQDSWSWIFWNLVISSTIWIKAIRYYKVLFNPLCMNHSYDYPWSSDWSKELSPKEKIIWMYPGNISNLFLLNKHLVFCFENWEISIVLGTIQYLLKQNFDLFWPPTYP